MYKNFSYLFGLGALLMLVACGEGDKKKASDGKQDTAVAENQESAEEIQATDETAKKETREIQYDDGIYSEINQPITLETERTESSIINEENPTGNESTSDNTAPTEEEVSAATNNDLSNEPVDSSSDTAEIDNGGQEASSDLSNNTQERINTITEDSQSASTQDQTADIPADIPEKLESTEQPSTDTPEMANSDATPPEEETTTEITEANESSDLASDTPLISEDSADQQFSEEPIVEETLNADESATESEMVN